jgi:hypothetical protein
MTRILAGLMPLALSACAFAAQDYRELVTTCLDTLIEHGQDTYGPEKAPILVSILDVETLTCPENPAVLDEPWRVTRRHRRNPAGADLSTDMPTLTVMKQLGGKYEAFAKAYAEHFLNHMVVENRGLPSWGWHEYYDVFKDECIVDQHELHAGVDPMDWEFLWAADADAVRRQAQNTWRLHVINKETGEINRHADGKPGCDFSMSAGSYIELFAFMYKQTHEPVWLDRAKLIATYYWDRRDTETNLVPERPNAGTERFDGGHFVTAITGCHCAALFNACEMTGEPVFRDYAAAYLRAYAKYGYDESTGRFWGSLRLDGTPNNEPVIREGYGMYEPRGYLDLWEPYLLGYQMPVYTGAAYLRAYALTEDPAMLDTAKKFANWILAERPGKAGIQEGRWYDEYAKTWAAQGTYADKYGRAILFLINMHKATGDARYLQGAQEYAEDAVGKLYRNGLFKGHPAKPYYEAVDGVGFLLQGLLAVSGAGEI